ncbi:MAG: N-formylglutamate deformylase [Polaromonas sp.]|nr:N-formylglutamate deformylase [Polaromonas sp.]
MTFTLQFGIAPMLVSMPHIGTDIPLELQAGYVPRALDVEDTDWHLARLYDFLPAMGISVLQPRYSRYVIDLNRPPDDAPMYPGASNTELCPTHFFNGDALYRPGKAPSLQEVQRRRCAYWQPYHDALAGELARIKAAHGFVLLWDAHSIRSHIPWLFDGKLPDFNIGTASGAAAATAVSDAASSQVVGFTHVVNGRFKGGYITRHYGQPASQVHAVQLEKCQSLYMQETPPFAYDEVLASHLQPTIQRMIEASLQAAKALYV